MKSETFKAKKNVTGRMQSFGGSFILLHC